MPSNNRLLDFDLMAPHLESVSRGARKHLERPNRWAGGGALRRPKTRENLLALYRKAPC
jgi:hypothetical protein